jgi:hypothetical protein
VDGTTTTVGSYDYGAMTAIWSYDKSAQPGMTVLLEATLKMALV